MLSLRWQIGCELWKEPDLNISYNLTEFIIKIWTVIISHHISRYNYCYILTVYSVFFYIKSHEKKKKVFCLPWRCFFLLRFDEMFNRKHLHKSVTYLLTEIIYWVYWAFEYRSNWDTSPPSSCETKKTSSYSSVTAL